MKHFFSFIVMLFVCIKSLTAQYLPNECGTIDTAQDFLQKIPPGLLKIATGPKVMKMYIVIYSDDDGTNQAINEDQLKNEIAFTNSIYNLGEICFVIAGIEYRKSTYYNNPPSSDDIDYSTEALTSYFTVFIVKTIGGGTFGWSPGTPASYMITKTEGFGLRRTFIHEMGHALGLHHTFKGTGHEPKDPGCEELVDGSNGATCGDLVADTPADPYIRCGNGISGCTFPYVSPNCEDANGASYIPQMNNFMSYWPNFNCNRTAFTAGQYEKMRTTIENNSTLTSFLISVYTNVLVNDIISSGTFSELTITSILAGNFNNGGNYIINGSANATISASNVILLPGFRGNPTNSTGIIRIMASSCQ